MQKKIVSKENCMSQDYIVQYKGYINAQPQMHTFAHILSVAHHRHHRE